MPADKYQLAFEQHTGYFKVTVTGRNSRETVAAYMQELLRESRQRDCFRVLIDDQLEGPRLDAMDVFAVASQGSMNALGVFDAIAYVDPRMGAMGEFAETVAINRGMPVAIFDSEEDAVSWLQKKDSGPDVFVPTDLAD